MNLRSLMSGRQFGPYIEGGTVLAHSAAFDVGVLTSTLRFYGIPQPEFRYLCTVQVAKAVWPTIGSYTLTSVANLLGIPLDHHNAAADAFCVRRNCQAGLCRKPTASRSTNWPSDLESRLATPAISTILTVRAKRGQVGIRRKKPPSFYRPPTISTQPIRSSVASLRSQGR